MTAYPGDPVMGEPVFTLTIEPNGAVMCSTCGLVEYVDVSQRMIDLFYVCPHLKGSLRIMLDAEKPPASA